MTELDDANFKAHFYERFDLPNKWQGFSSIVQFLKTLKGDRRFHLLFSILCDENEMPYDFQKVAAGLMLKVDANCPLTVQEAVMPILDTLDLSVQEFPFFLAKQLGRDHVLSELKNVDSPNLSKHQKLGLDTLIYWAQGFSDSEYSRLRRSWSDRIKG